MSSSSSGTELPLAQKRLFASIHDVGPGARAQVERLVSIYEQHLGSARYAMLVVPDHWGRHPIRDDKNFQIRLREWAEGGVEMFVHGWYHKDHADHANGLARFKARHMTAGEGEFLGLDRATAFQRMRDARALIEDIIGRPTAGFVAPAWLYGEGAKHALRDAGFAIAEDHMQVWDPRDDRRLARGPVITWASRSAMRTASSIAFAALARTALPRLRDVRLAVHPGDVTKPSLVRSIDATLARFVRTHRPARYAELLG